MKKVPTRRANNRLSKKRVVRPVNRKQVLAVANKRVRNMRRRLNRSGAVFNSKPSGRSIVPRNKLTPDGLGFLKCAFAPPDFAETQVRGIPDSYRGKTLLKKHRLTANLTLNSTLDYYIILAPTPGIAYWVWTGATGTLPSPASVWTAVAYSDLTALFADGNKAADILNSYRMVSNHFELISTTNQMSYSGTISVLKCNLNLINRNQATDIWSITGLQSSASTNCPIFSTPTINGVYVGCYNSQVDFPFQPILENISSACIPATIAASDWGQLSAAGVGVFPGFYNGFESSVIKITNMSTTNTMIVKCWSCVEYQVVNTSTLTDYTSVSPPLDMVAIRAYREIVLSLPIAVMAKDNAGFWQRVLSILRTITGVGAALPGPYGIMSGGVNSIVGGIQELML